MKKLTWKTGGIYDSISYIDGIFEYRTDGTDEQNLLHIMDDRSRIATIRIGDDFGDTTPAIKYNLEDNIGSSVMQLEDDGTNINKEEYYPFGETSFGSYAYKRYKYCGKERDEESGLYYYGARYYAAWTCRFISVDPLAADYPHLTPYNYAGNKPIGDIDIDGMQGSGEQTSGGNNGGTPYGPQKQPDAPRASMPEINGVSGPWSNEAIEAASPHVNLPEVKVRAYPDFIAEPDSWDTYIMKKGIESFSPKLNTPANADQWQKDFENWAWQAEVDKWNGLSLDKKWTEARFQIYTTGMTKLAQETMQPAYEGYQIMAMAGGSGLASGGPVIGSVLSKAGALTDDIAKTFRFGQYTEITLQESLTLTRYYDDVNAFAKGRFMTNSVSSSKMIDRVGLALRPSWNQMTKVAEWEIPAGSTIYMGEAAMQFPFLGGKTQYFIPKAVLDASTRIK